MSEIRVTDEVRIDAPIDTVWAAIEDPVAQVRWHPFVNAISGEHRLGQVRTCSVIVGGKHGKTTERCVVEEPASGIAWLIEQDSTGFGRMVSNWRAGFSLTRRNGATVATAESTFEPRGLLVRAALPIIRRGFHQTQQAILGALKQSLETHRDVIDLGNVPVSNRHVTSRVSLCGGASRNPANLVSMMSACLDNAWMRCY